MDAWDKEIERLKDLFEQGLLGEDDKEEMAKKFNTTVSQVDDCLMDIDINDMPETLECYKCHEPFSLDEIAMNNGYCNECAKEENS